MQGLGRRRLSMVGNERDLELLRDAYSGWARGDFSRPDMWDSEVEFVIAGVESRTYTGPQGVREGWFDFLSARDDFRVEGVDYFEGAQDNTYVVFCHLSGCGKESGLPIEAEAANLIVVRNGRIVRFALFWDRDEALEAGGLAPP
jgi:ketosteroid isomerase-like protein